MVDENKCTSFKSEALIDKTGHTLFRVVYRQKNGQEIVKVISIEDYLNLLGASIKETVKYSYIPEGFFPEGYLGGSYADEKNYTAVWKVPARKRTLNYYRGGRKIIPFPALVFSVKVSNGYASGHVFALKSGNTLYQYPFGNVATSGSICMGNIHVDTEMGPKSFEDDFFAGITNDDYFQPGTHVALRCSQPDLIKKLADKDKFPDKYLKRPDSARVQTIEELVKAAKVS